MTQVPMTTRRPRRARKAAAALVVLAALTAAGCSSGSSKSSTKTTDSGITTNTKKKSKSPNSDTSALGSDTGGLSSDTGHVKTTKNLSTDMHSQMQDTGQINTTSGSTFTVGSISFTIPSGWQQGTDDSGNSVLVNGQGAKVTALQDPDYQGGGATQELKSLEQQLQGTATVQNEGSESTIANGDATADIFVGTVDSQPGYSVLVVAITTKSEGYALLTTFPTSSGQTVASDLDTMINSITVS